MWTARCTLHDANGKQRALSTRERVGAGVRVTAVRDLGTGLDTAQPDRRARLPWSPGDKFVSFMLDDDLGVVTIRASGTEPKLKYYLEVRHAEEASARALADQLAAAVLDDVLQPQRFNFAVKE